MNSIVRYAAVLVVGILIGSLGFYAWTQLSPAEAPRNAAFTEYGDTSTMTYRGFLKVADITGSTFDSEHRGAIEVLEFSWGETMDADAAFGGTSVVRPEKADFRFVFWWDDRACVDLVEACTKGTVFPEATFSVRSSTMVSDYLQVELRNVIISSFQTHGNVFEGTGPICELHLAFVVINVRTFEFSSTGAPIGGDEFTWDYESSTPS
jgi:type VI secretion system secreted protein Hcp